MASFVSEKIQDIQFKTLPWCKISDEQMVGCNTCFDGRYGTLE